MTNQRLGLRASFPLGRFSAQTPGLYALDQDISAVIRDLTTLGVTVKGQEIVVLPTDSQWPQLFRWNSAAVAWNLSKSTRLEFWPSDPNQFYTTELDSVFQGTQLIRDLDQPLSSWQGYGPELIDLSRPIRARADLPGIKVRAQAHLILDHSWSQCLELFASRLR